MRTRRIRQFVKIYRQYSDSTIRCRAFCAVVNKGKGRWQVSMEMGKMCLTQNDELNKNVNSSN